MPTHPLILITGGRGRLASAAREALAAAGMDTRSFSRTAGEGHLALEDLLHPGVCEDAHALVHTAWSTVPLVSERDPGCEWQNDFPWLIRLLRHLAEHQTKRPPHFIFFSSGGTVYGDAPPSQSSCEDSPLRPKGWHGFAKVQAEQLVRETCARFNLPCTILRIANPYGMLATNIRPQGIIPILIRRALDGEEFHLWGDGSAEKDFLHIKDFNSALVTVLTNKITGTFNLCYGRSFSVNTLIHEVERLTSRKIKVVHGPSPLWDVTASRLDNSAFCKAANWTPRIDFTEGLMECIQTISQNPSQLQN
jgi:UDP-glucose 4-epimerase